MGQLKDLARSQTVEFDGLVSDEKKKFQRNSDGETIVS